MTRRALLIWAIFLLGPHALWAPPRTDGETSFRDAMTALAAKDYAAALPLFEDAIRSDPDNLRYASEYRQAIIQAKLFDRSVQFFEKLTAEHAGSAHAHLNFGFAYVDKIPAAGSITQVILANNALTEFSKAVEIRKEWISYYTRGNAYLFWPKVFEKAPLGVADLNEAMKIQEHEPKRAYHVRTFISLGDGYWKVDQVSRARSVWRKGLKEFPNNAQLRSRLAVDGDALKALLEDAWDPSKRVDTDLRDLWADQ